MQNGMEYLKLLQERNALLKENKELKEQLRQIEIAVKQWREENE